MSCDGHNTILIFILSIDDIDIDLQTHNAVRTSRLVKCNGEQTNGSSKWRENARQIEQYSKSIETITNANTSWNRVQQVDMPKLFVIVTL